MGVEWVANSRKVPEGACLTYTLILEEAPLLWTITQIRMLRTL